MQVIFQSTVWHFLSVQQQTVVEYLTLLSSKSDLTCGQCCKRLHIFLQGQERPWHVSVCVLWPLSMQFMLRGLLSSLGILEAEVSVLKHLFVLLQKKSKCKVSLKQRELSVALSIVCPVHASRETRIFHTLYS